MSEPIDFTHPRDAIMRAIERVYRYRMTTTSGGNLSIREARGDVWITPARVDKGGATRDDIVCVRPDGDIGRHKPSSELPFHRAIYAARPDIWGIVHAHPVALVAFSICGRRPTRGCCPQRAGFAAGSASPPTPCPAAKPWAGSIAHAFAGASTASCSRTTASSRAARACRRPSSGSRPWSSAQDHHQGGPARRGSLPDRRQAERAPPVVTAPAVAVAAPCAPSRKAAPTPRVRPPSYRQRLMISTQGAFSARLDDESFLITPHRVDRSTLDVADIVLVSAGARRAGKNPSNRHVNHRAIYNAHTKVGAIVAAYPVNATAFSVTDPLDARTIPESYIFLRQLPRALWRPVRRRPRAGVADNLAQSCLDSGKRRRPGLRHVGPGRLRPARGAGVDGRGMINSRPLGKMVPMSDAVIAELEDAFFSKP